jgi:hypothetical protein
LFTFLLLETWPNLCSNRTFRKELLWPELDQLLRDEDDASGASTPYTAAIPEYRVVFIDPSEAPAHLENSWSLANGHSTIDLQHPVRLGVFRTLFLKDFGI